ncbi:MAG: ABC transporter ATP-binding protein, partial [Acidobacteria bacterium]|nr:ABC transporter ATP-binding protein [Acidobacteriota bacterium]
MTTVIKAENLSKLYYLGAGKSDSLRDAVMNFVKKPALSKEKHKLWALHDVSFEVKDGETLGIIGNNGAGKSTLLKILSRITKPTTGTAQLKGRVGSLLEVGTGFHNELTGRENIYLNGAILGMKRAEIEKQFDEIVAFSELEKFLDTPVKHYSSGMYMRLAFAVAAHLEPEILIVDEVLAVGDADFQHKCLDKMQAIMNEGRTILFVSHNMSAIMRLCSRAIALKKGKIVQEGATQTVVNEYLGADWGVSAERVWENESEAPQNKVVRLKSVRVIDENGKTAQSLDITRRIGLQTSYEVLQAGHILITAFHIYGRDRQYLFGLQDVMSDWRQRERETGIYTSTVWIPKNFFNEGGFVVDVAISSHVPATRVHVHEGEAVGFEVVDNLTGRTTRGDYQGTIQGFIRPNFEWQTELKQMLKT